MKERRLIILCATISLMSFTSLGCALRNIRKGDVSALPPNEGYVVAAVRVNSPDCMLVLEPKDVPGKKFFFEDWFGFGPFLREENFIAVRVPAGTYALPYFRLKGFLYYLHDLEIRVEPGCVNYIGTLEIDVLSDAPGEPCRYRLLGDDDRLTRVFSARYPELAATCRPVDASPGHGEIWKCIEGRFF